MVEEKQEDLKNEGEKPIGDDGQPEKKEKTQEELIAEKDAEVERIKAENDRLTADNVNYKQAITNKAADDFTLEDEEEEESKPTSTPEVPKADDEDRAWQEVDKRAQAMALKTYAGQTKKEVLANEKVAKKQMFLENPEVLTNPAMKLGIREYYVNRHGKSVEGIKLDMVDALCLYKVNNNISLEEKKTKETPPENNMPNMPTGSSNNTTTEKSDELNQSDKDIITKYAPGLSEEAMLRYKKAVLSEERSAPQEVINLFKSGI